MASPQPDKHTRVSNELVDAFCRLKLSPNESQILWCVLRKTYGWNKKEDKISLTQFQKQSELSRPSVIKAIAKLVAKQILVAKQQPGSIKTYALQKDYEKWNFSGSYTDTSSRLATTLVAKQLPKLVAKQQHTKDKKDNIQKTILSTEQVGGLQKAISLFGNINPSYEILFKRKNQRDAAERLLSKFGLPALEKLIEAARQANGMQFAPTITTPCQLEDKLGQLKSYYDKNQKKGVKVWKA